MEGSPYVVFSQRAFNAIITETIDKHPIETGGILLGYVLDNGAWIVVENIPPGYQSIHQTAYFEYDEEFVTYLSNVVAKQYKGNLVYTSAASLCNSYKNIYADGKLYEIVNVTQHAGSYFVQDGVSVEDDGNILYHITKKIFLIGAAAFVSKAQEETYQGETVYRYDVMVNEKKVTLWYNSEVLVKIFVSLPTETEGEYEQYTIKLSDYSFDADLPADAFKRPDTYGITYVESPISFEDWTTIITSFASKLG